MKIIAASILVLASIPVSAHFDNWWIFIAAYPLFVLFLIAPKLQKKGGK